MAQAKEAHVEDNIQIGDAASAFGKKALAVGGASLALAIVLGGGPFGQQFQASYLVAFMYVLALGLGSLWFVTIQHLTNAKWSVVVRRVAEINAANMVVVFGLSLFILLPMLTGQSALYVWLDHAKVEASHTLHHKAGYLNLPFFLVRFAFYFGFWVLLSRHFLKQSVAQDSSGKAEISGSLQAVSAPAMVVLGLTLTFCSIDLVMSLDPDFFSTAFGVYYFAGCVSSAYSLLALSLMWLQGQGRLVNSVNTEHFHDLGKMMFAFVVFWSYIAFSQFMLIWYADMPEETHWFHVRFEGEWKVVSGALLACHFVIPFFGLLSRHVKRNRKSLAFWAVWLLVVEYLDMYWLIMPEVAASGEVPLSIVDLLAWVGVVGLFVGAAAVRSKSVNLLPTKDPRLADSLAFENI